MKGRELKRAYLINGKIKFCRCTKKFVKCTIDSVNLVISKENDLDKFANKIITEIERL